MSTCPTSYAENLPKQIFAKIYEARKLKIIGNITKARKLHEKKLQSLSSKLAQGNYLKVKNT